jgi:hypothetical protein
MAYDYTALKADVAAYLHRSDLTSTIPTFIEAARLRIGRDLRGACNFVTNNVTGFSSELAALPTNVSRLVSVSSNGYPLESVSYDIALVSGNCYAVVGSNLFVPGSDSSTTVTVYYYAIPAALVNGTDITYGMADAPMLWRWGSLMEAGFYLRDMELLAMAGQQFDDEVRRLNAAHTETRWANPAVVSTQPMLMGVSTL